MNHKVSDIHNLKMGLKEAFIGMASKGILVNESVGQSKEEGHQIMSAQLTERAATDESLWAYAFIDKQELSRIEKTGTARISFKHFGDRPISRNVSREIITEAVYARLSTDSAADTQDTIRVGYAFRFGE